jgi:hypothetical protein
MRTIGGSIELIDLVAPHIPLLIANHVLRRLPLIRDGLERVPNASPTRLSEFNCTCGQLPAEADLRTAANVTASGERVA